MHLAAVLPVKSVPHLVLHILTAVLFIPSVFHLVRILATVLPVPFVLHLVL